MEKHSRQRDAVYEEMCSRRDHPTAEEVYLSLKARIPALSLATVYRNLTRLSEEGKLLRLCCETSDRFDADISEHGHMTCEKCGKVVDIRLEPGYLNMDKLYGFEGIITSKQVTFRGYCSQCADDIQ